MSNYDGTGPIDPDTQVGADGNRYPIGQVPTDSESYREPSMQDLLARIEELEAGGGTSTADAADIDFTPAGNLSATDVQAALVELDTEKVTKATFPVDFTFALSDETTAITAGTAKVTWRAPYAFTLTAVRASLTAASTSGTPTVDVNEAGTTVLSTKLTIDANELTSTTAAAAAVISDAAIADDAEVTFDIDVAGTGAKGLKVTLYGTRVAP